MMTNRITRTEDSQAAEEPIPVVARTRMNYSVKDYKVQLLEIKLLLAQK